ARVGAVRAHVPDELARADGRQRGRDPADPRDLHRVPALLRRRRRGGGSKGLMRVGQLLRVSFREFYENSWRLLPVNAALGSILVAVAFATIVVHAAL